MRWDKDYKNPEVINDPTVIPAYGVTDEERARWDAKQDALEYDAEPTQYSDKHMISGAIYNALERYKVQTVELAQAFFWGQAEGLGETKTACEAAQAAAELAQEAAETAQRSAEFAQGAAESAEASAEDWSTYSENSARNALNSEYIANQSKESALRSKYDAEAWAKGTRNGIPVQISDPAYDNNAKYYAEHSYNCIDDTRISATTTWSSSKLSTSKADLVDGKVPSTQLPSYVDDVIERSSISYFPNPGESGKIYVALDTNKTYRWSGSTYVEISESIVIGTVSGTAYEGSRGVGCETAIGRLTQSIESLQTAVGGIYSDYYTANQVEARLDTKANNVHDHDDLYYTKAQIDQEFSIMDADKANIVHDHDDRYYVKSELDATLAYVDDMISAGVTFTISGGVTYINW